MKKIAIVTRQLVAGGIESALISMIESIPKDGFEITLFVMATGGDFSTMIPDYVKIIPIYGIENSVAQKVITNLKRGKLIHALKIGYYYVRALTTKSSYKSEKFLLKTINRIDESFDIAIAYHVPASFPVIFVTKFLNSKFKVGWIHSDIEEYQAEMKLYVDYYKNFDKIFCVSKYALEKFNMLYPTLSEKTEVFYNIIHKDKLFNLANQDETFNDNFQGLRILTVGRLTLQKGYDIIPEVILKLKEEGYYFRWYCIGEGELRSILEDKIMEYGLQENLILLGTKINPYPYFKDCDIYVQSSRHEGYCITLAEARLFNKPIVTTDFVGAREQIINNSTGKIVSFNEIELENAIKQFLISEKNRIKYILNLEKENSLDNEKVNINKILKLCSENI